MNLEYLNDKIGPNEMVAICWLYAVVKASECKCELMQAVIPNGDCVRCRAMKNARQAWPFTVAVIEGEA